MNFKVFERFYVPHLPDKGYINYYNIRKAWEILNKIQPKFARDLLVRSPVEIEQRIAGNDFLIKEILEKGKVIYESANSMI